MLSIRTVVESDVSELTRLADLLGYPSANEDVLTNLKELIPDPNHEIYVAETGDGLLAGFIHVFVTRRLFINLFSELGALVVDENWRGKGVGKLLLNEAEDWAATRGCQEMRVRSNILREKAHGFYLQQGYGENKKQTVFLKKIIPLSGY